MRRSSILYSKAINGMNRLIHPNAGYYLDSTIKEADQAMSNARVLGYDSDKTLALECLMMICQEGALELAQASNARTNLVRKWFLKKYGSALDNGASNWPPFFRFRSDIGADPGEMALTIFSGDRLSDIILDTYIDAHLRGLIENAPEYKLTFGHFDGYALMGAYTGRRRRITMEFPVF